MLGSSEAGPGSSKKGAGSSEMGRVSSEKGLRVEFSRTSGSQGNSSISIGPCPGWALGHQHPSAHTANCQPSALEVPSFLLWKSRLRSLVETMGRYGREGPRGGWGRTEGREEGRMGGPE